MGGIRDFGAQEGHFPAVRNVDNDAPLPMRQEILAVAYDVLPMCRGGLTEETIYYGIEQLLGEQAAGNPMAGWRQRLGRDLANAEWVRIYDTILWLWRQFYRADMHEVFRVNMNQVLAAHAVVWELTPDGNLQRVLPAAAQAQVEAAIQELRRPEYAPALERFNDAKDAYDDRPRRDRDACTNIFDAMESTSKIKYEMPNATFGDVVNNLRRRNTFNSQILNILEGINALRNRNFGHGMAAEFNFTAAEVDFTYISCIGAILLFTHAA